MAPGGRGPRPSSPPPSSYRVRHADSQGYFTKRSLDRLHDYEGFAASADGVEESLTQPYLQPLWDRAVDTLPSWYRPGVATLTGLVLVAASTFSLLWNTLANDGSDAAPLWPNFFSGVCVLIYQVLGATENTRVRRATAKASRTVNAKEGAYWIFWHGCNSIAVGFLLLGVMLELQVEQPSTVMLGLLFGFTAAYFAHWQKYVSGHRRVTSQFVDVAETQLILASVHFFTAAFGRGVWRWVVFLDWQINHIVLALLMWRAAIVMLNYWLIIVEGGPGEDGTTTAGTAVLSPVIPGASVLVLAWVLVSSRTSAFDKVPFLSILAVMFIYAKVLNKLIVAQATKTPIEQIDVMILPGVLLWLGSHVGLELESKLGLGPNTLSIAIYCLAMTANLVVYWWSMTKEISGHVRVDILGMVNAIAAGKAS